VAATDDPLEAHGDLSLPPQPGTYALLLRLERDCALTVGRLGRFCFPAGIYVYVGSGHGPGGMAARVARHLREPKPRRWHVDYLRPHAWPVEIWCAIGARKRECVWAQTLLTLPGASIPVPRFGASDCRCPAHLVHFSALPDRAAFAQAVGGPVMEVYLDE